MKLLLERNKKICYMVVDSNQDLNRKNYDICKWRQTVILYERFGLCIKGSQNQFISSMVIGNLDRRIGILELGIGCYWIQVGYRLNPIHIVILVAMSSIQIYNSLLEMIVQIDIIQSCLSTIEYEKISVVSIVHLIVGLSSLLLNEIKILCHRIY